MKHLIFVAFGLTAVFGLISCGNSGEKDSFGTETIEWSDSVVVDSSKAVCKIDVEWPVQGGQAVVDSVRSWIVWQLGHNGYVGDATDTNAYDTKVADPADGAAVVAAVGGDVLSRAKSELASIEYSFPMTYEYSWHIGPNYTTDKLVTFGAATYAYIGGAHGASTYFGQTFSLSDGSRLGWNMIDGAKMAELRNVIRQALIDQYFKVKDSEELKNCMLVDPDTLPMPVANPVCEQNGMVFTYQQYEIAPYAAGMPSVMIPYAVIKSLLTAAACEVVP